MRESLAVVPTSLGGAERRLSTKILSDHSFDRINILKTRLELNGCIGFISSDLGFISSNLGAWTEGQDSPRFPPKFGWKS